MKLIVAVIKPFRLDDVKHTLEALGVQGMTLTEAQASVASADTPRSTAAPSTRSTPSRSSAWR